MPVLGPVNAPDQYDGKTAIMQNQFGSLGGFFVVANNPCFVQQQYSSKNKQGSEDWTQEVELGAGANVTLSPRCIGVQFRNATPGFPAQITAQIAIGDEPPLTISALGNIVANSLIIPGQILNYGFHFANVITAGNNFAGGADLLSPSPISFTADGISDYAVFCTSRSWQLNNVNHLAEAHINLDGADAGQIGQIISVLANLGDSLNAMGPIVGPAAGSHTINVRVFADTAGDTLTVIGGAGGVGGSAPIVVGVMRL